MKKPILTMEWVKIGNQWIILDVHKDYSGTNIKHMKLSLLK